MRWMNSGKPIGADAFSASAYCRLRFLLPSDDRRVRSTAPRGQTSEAAIGAKPELREEFPDSPDPLLEPRHIVNGAEIHPSALRFQLARRDRYLKA